MGISFGGAVSMLFAHLYPELVENLLLLCPAIKTPIYTDAFKSLSNGDYSCLIPMSGDDLKSIAQLVSNKSRSSKFFPKKIMNSV